MNHPEHHGAGRGHSIIALDLLRGMAAIEVFLFHVRGFSYVKYSDLPPQDHTALAAVLFALTRFGLEAVQIFFAISGYLVFGQIIRRVRNGRFNIRVFSIDRATRIFLPLIPACLLAALVQAALFKRPVNYFQIAANMVGLTDVAAPRLHFNGPVWTMPYEIWFYAIGGAGAYMLVRRKASLAAIAVLLCGAIVFCFLTTEFLLLWLLSGAVVFVEDTKYKAWFAALGAAMCGFGLVVMELTFKSDAMPTLTAVPEAAGPFFTCVGAALTFPFLATSRVNEFFRPLRGPAATLSTISFSLYLFHFPVNAALDKIFPKAGSLSVQALLMFGARIAISLAVVLVCYYAFERNTPALRRAVTRWTEGPKLPSVAGG